MSRELPNPLPIPCSKSFLLAWVPSQLLRHDWPKSPEQRSTTGGSQGMFGISTLLSPNDLFRCIDRSTKEKRKGSK